MTTEKTDSEGYGKSKGEKLFNWLTYGGISGLGVFITTAILTHWAKYGGGSQLQGKFINWATKKGMGTHAAEQIYNTGFLGIMGNAAIVPVKIAEDHKPQIIEKLNNMLGESDEIEIVKHEPRQTWWSLIKSRITAYAAVWIGLQSASSLIGPKKFGAFESKFAENIVCKPLGAPTHTIVNGVKTETKMFHYGKIMALDIFATSAAAALLYLSSRIFAKKEKKEDVITATAPKASEEKTVEAEGATNHADKVKSCMPCHLKHPLLSERVVESRKNSGETHIAAV